MIGPDQCLEKELGNDLNFDTKEIEDINLGMKASYSHTITKSDIETFADLSGDHNPVHVNDVYAETSKFGKRVAHGLLSASFFSGLFGTQLPGPGCLYVSQNLKFRRPVFIGDTVVAEVEVIKLDVKRRRVFFSTVAQVGGKTVITGEAEIVIPEH